MLFHTEASSSAQKTYWLPLTTAESGGSSALVISPLVRLSHTRSFASPPSMWATSLKMGSTATSHYLRGDKFEKPMGTIAQARAQVKLSGYPSGNSRPTWHPGCN